MKNSTKHSGSTLTVLLLIALGVALLGVSMLVAQSDTERSAYTAPADRIVAGTMTERDICQTTSYLVRQARGQAYKTIGIPCSVSVHDRGVEIRSGYRLPDAMGSRVLTYTAQGFVGLNGLRLNTIQVHGIDDAPIPFSDF